MATTTVKAVVAGAALSVAGLVGFNANGDVTVKCSTAKITFGTFSENKKDGGLLVEAHGAAYTGIPDAGAAIEGNIHCEVSGFDKIKSVCLPQWRKQYCP